MTAMARWGSGSVPGVGLRLHIAPSLSNLPVTLAHRSYRSLVLLEEAETQRRPVNECAGTQLHAAELEFKSP